MATTFPQRLKSIIGSRTPTTWGKSLGLAQNMVSRMMQGSIPGAEALTKIMRAENASLSWLVDGIGKPFYVNACMDPDTFLADISAEGLDADFDELYILESSTAPVLIYRTFTQTEQQDKSLFSYAGIRIYTTPWTTSVRAKISELAQHPKANLRRLPEADTRAIRNGEVGTFAIFGDDTTRGLIHQPDIVAEAYAINEPTAQLTCNNALVDGKLLSTVIDQITGVIRKSGIELSSTQFSHVVTAACRHTQRGEKITAATITAMIEAARGFN